MGLLRTKLSFLNSGRPESSFSNYCSNKTFKEDPLEIKGSFSPACSLLGPPIDPFDSPPAYATPSFKLTSPVDSTKETELVKLQNWSLSFCEKSPNLTGLFPIGLDPLSPLSRPASAATRPLTPEPKIGLTTSIELTSAPRATST
ncbi:hypothetical protein V6Z11_A08G195800 [Gossypium hirsutum]